jgi:hypothetical protein
MNYLMTKKIELENNVGQVSTLLFEVAVRSKIDVDAGFNCPAKMTRVGFEPTPVKTTALT